MSTVKLIAGAAFVLAAAAASWLSINARRTNWVNMISVRVDRPAQEVFPWLCEPAKRKQWILFLTESQWAGSELLREAISDHGQTFRADVRVVRRQEGQLIETSAATEDFEWDQTYELSEDGGVTTLRIRIETRYKPWLARAMAPLVSRDVQATWERHAGQLRLLLSQNPRGDESK